MRNVLNALTLLTVIAPPALAQVPATLELSRASASGILSVPTQSEDLVLTSQNRQRDSLLNGVLVGAGTGAMLGLAFGVSREDACRACAGFNQPLAYGVLFGGVGAAIGAGIDAMFQRMVPAAPRAYHIRVEPMLSRDIRGVSGRVRF